MHSCDQCRTNFDCHTLSTALKVMAAHRDELSDPDAKNRYDTIVGRLAQAGWKYPDGAGACALANLPRDVQALTAELVRLWQKTQFAPNADVEGMFAEEARAE